MKSVKFSTSNEEKLIKGIQHEIGAYEDGYAGTQTLLNISIKLNAQTLPLTLEMFDCAVIVAKDIIPFNPKGALSKYDNSMLGSFTYPRATTPCSILVNRGGELCSNSCHAHLSKPETVIYRDDEGIHVKRVMSTSELPKVKWAVGGMGLLSSYNPVSEGFSGAYADVLRKTDHNVLAVKNGILYGVYFKNKTADEINTICRDKFKFDNAILLDGGGLASINGSEKFAKKNISCKQGYAIQFV